MSNTRHSSFSQHLLLGRHATQLGEIRVIGTRQTGAAISMGGAPKRYPYSDPNEDAAAVCEGPMGLFIAVADAHDGVGASEVVVTRMLSHAVPSWLESEEQLGNWPSDVVRVLESANSEVLRLREQTGTNSQTTLAFAVAYPTADRLLCASFGDSHIYLVTKDDIRELTLGHADSLSEDFVGDARATLELRERCLALELPLTGTRAVILATDGITRCGIGLANPAEVILATVCSAADMGPERRASTVAYDLTQTAIDAQRQNDSGDNVAVAVAWLDEWRTW